MRPATITAAVAFFSLFPALQLKHRTCLTALDGRVLLLSVFLVLTWLWEGIRLTNRENFVACVNKEADAEVRRSMRSATVFQTSCVATET